jgi:cysteine desulfurase
LTREIIFATAMSASPADEMTRCLVAVGKDPDQIAQVARLSIGWTTSEEQIDRVVQRLANAMETVRS